MKQVFLRGGRGVVEDVPAPVVGDNSVLVQVAYSHVSVQEPRCQPEELRKESGSPCY